MPAWAEISKWRRKAVNSAAVGVVALALSGCDDVVAFDSTPLSKTVSPDEERKTACRGLLSIKRMRREIWNAKHKGADPNTVPELRDDLPYEEAAVDALVDHINQLSCEYPDIAHPDIQKNTVTLCGEEMVIGVLRDKLIVINLRSEPKSLENGIKDYRTKYCPEENETPTPKVA